MGNNIALLDPNARADPKAAFEAYIDQSPEF